MIIELELYLYKRLASVRGVRLFKLTFVEIVQLVLGTNGCGKSSVAREANALPGERNDFFPGGYKKVTFKNKGETYVALSSFDKGQHHSLIRQSDMVELNPGGTVTIQKDLIYGLTMETREIRNMLDGAERFTTMTAARRREWLTKLCVVDYTYAIGVYKKAQKKARDASGYVENLGRRLIAETAKLLSEEQIKELRDKHSAMTRETQQLYLLRNASSEPLDDVKERASQLQMTLMNLTNQFKSARRVLRDKYWHHPEAVQQSVEDAALELGRAQAAYDMACKRYEELTKDGEVGESVTDEQLKEMMERVIEIDKAMQTALSRRKLALQWQDPVSANQQLTSIYDDMRDIFTTIFENPDRKYNSDRHKELCELQTKLTVSIRAAEDKLNGLRHQLSHMDALANKEDIECPKCEHGWKIGYDANLHETLRTSLDTGVKYLEQRQAELKAVEEELADSTKYMEQMKQVLQTMRYTGSLQPLWDMFFEHDMVRKNPRACLMNMDMARADLLHDLQASALKLEFDSLQEKVRKAKETQTEAHAAKVRDIEQASKEISYCVGGLRLAQDRLSEGQKFLKEYNNIAEIHDRVKMTMRDLEKCTQEAVDSIKNDIIDAATAEAMGEIANLARTLNQIDIQIATVKDIEAQIVVGNEDYAAYNLVVKSLSPIDGIIAEGMLGFIRDYVARMNAFVAKIWTYPLEIKDCSMEENTAELNYRFPLIVNNDTLDPKPDVSAGSEGMQEVVDLSFRIAAGQCLQLDTGTLVLDEFGRTFDETHREAATHVIRQIMEQLHYSQFIIISHYAASHGSFYKAQMTVIDKRNITIPAGQEYNVHTVIET